MMSTTQEFQLQDIPDLSGLGGLSTTESEPFQDGWYNATIVERRQFTDKNGNDRIFTSEDTPSANGNSRNIQLQTIVKRQSDGRTLNTSYRVNYRPEDLSQTTIQQITAQQQHVNEGGDWGELFRPFMTLTRLSRLQKIAGVHQFARNGNGGLNLHGLFGKNVYVRLKDDDRNPQYKMIADISGEAPKRAKVL